MAQPYGSDGNYATHPNKTLNKPQQPERDDARTTGYSEPTTMILDHLTFSPKLSTGAVASFRKTFGGLCG